jgi:hypothetical protein
MAKHKASPPAAVRRRIGGAGASAIRWALRVATSIVAWTLLLHLFTFLGIPRPPLPIARPSCLGGRSNSTAADSVVAAGEAGHLAPPALPPRSEWLSSSSTGGLLGLGVGFHGKNLGRLPALLLVGGMGRFVLPRWRESECGSSRAFVRWIKLFSRVNKKGTLKLTHFD